MTTSIPTYSQWRTSDKIYLLKQSNTDDLLVRVYNCSYKCLHKEHHKISELGLSAEVKISTCPRAVIQHLLEINALGKEFTLPQSATFSIPECLELLSQAIKTVQPQISAESRELEIFKCPLTLELFREPVMDTHGHTFEKAAIERYFNGRRYANCPVNRQQIQNTLIPNLDIKNALDELRAKEPIPTTSKFKEENTDLATANVKMARTYVNRKEYQKALRHYEEMLEHTRDSELYSEIPNLFDQMIEPEKAILSRLYLASYQIAEGKLQSACRALEEVHSANESIIEVTFALIMLYLDQSKEDEAIALLNKIKPQEGETHRHKVINFCYSLIDSYPGMVVFCDSLASWVDNPDESRRIRLRGACAALEGLSYEAALVLTENMGSAPFIDQLVRLSTLQQGGTNEQVLDELNALANLYFKNRMTVQEVKVWKQIAHRQPISEAYGRIVKCYKILNKSEKLLFWLDQWLPLLMEEENWATAEKVALNAKNLSIDKLPYNECLEKIYAHVESPKFKDVCLELGVEYSARNLWDKAARVYNLGKERFGGFELTLGYANALNHLSMGKEATIEYYAASEAALLEGKSEHLSSCIERIKEIDPMMYFLGKNERMHILTQGEIVKLRKQVKDLEQRLTSTSTEKPEIALEKEATSSQAAAAACAALPESTQVPVCAFGAKMWEKYFGKVDKEPPLPGDIEELLDKPCPITKDGRTIRQTHVLTLIPSRVDGERFSLHLLGQLIESPKGGGHRAEFEFFKYKAKQKFGFVSIDEAYWFLMPRNVVKEVKWTAEYDEHDLKNHTNGFYNKLPSILEVVTMILLEHVHSGKMLFSGKHLVTHNRIPKCQLTVQSTNQSTILIGHGKSFYSLPIAPVRRFYPGDKPEGHSERFCWDLLVDC